MSRKQTWTGMGLDEAFDDIRIVDLEERKTTWSRVHESMRVVHLRLTRAPDGQWIRLFHEERESRIMARRSGFWIDDDEISFDCLLPDVEIHHLPDIERSLAYANRRYHELVVEQRRSRGARQGDVRAEREELRALRDRIRERYAHPEPSGPPAASPPPAVARGAAMPRPVARVATPPLAESRDATQPVATQPVTTSPMAPPPAAAAPIAVAPVATQPVATAAAAAVAEATPIVAAEPASPPAAAAAPDPVAAADIDAELEARRRDLRERFRTALAHQIYPEEPNRGDR